MKYFKLTYYLLFICIVAASCSTDDSIIPDQTGEEVRVQLTIQFPEAATRATSESEGIDNERNISNVRLYVFETDGTSYKFKEEAYVASTSDADGSGNRTITGILSKGYSNGIKLVALANLENKRLDFGSLPVEGTSLADFYQTLKYTRTAANQWPVDGNDQLPMWGECDMEAPQPGFNNGSLTLIRAVAKVEVLINGGKGFSDTPFFKISQIEVRHNDRGYCTPGSDTNTPNVPMEPERVMTKYAGSTDYACENRIYIPEQKNTGDVNEDSKVLLNLTAFINETGDKTKTFTIKFKKNGTGADFDVLRNNVYVFNIISVKIEKEIPVEITLSYTVKEWEEINIPVTPFGN